MSNVVGIRFKKCGKVYDFEVNGLEVKKGDAVIVESDLGLSIGHIVVEGHPASEEARELKKVLRKATDDDLQQKEANRGLEEEAMAYCIERIMARGLPMKMICTEVTLDKRRIIFYFTAEGRIDFRELVKDLAAKFKTRIEMRQIGVRDASKVMGGIGICGRELCCRTFLTSFEPISIRMAKSQELVLNANKLSGVCGRLMCCLGYEYGEPEVTRSTAPEREGESPGEETGQEFFEEPAPAVYEETREAPPARREERGKGSERPAPSRREERRKGSERPAPPRREERRTAGEEKGAAEVGKAVRVAPEEPVRGDAQTTGQEAASGEQGSKKFHKRRRPRRRFRK